MILPAGQNKDGAVAAAMRGLDRLADAAARFRSGTSRHCIVHGLLKLRIAAADQHVTGNTQGPRHHGLFQLYTAHRRPFQIQFARGQEVVRNALRIVISMVQIRACIVELVMKWPRMLLPSAIQDCDIGTPHKLADVRSQPAKACKV